MILAFDTATRATTVALARADGVDELRDDPPPDARPRHTTRLLPLIAELLDRAGAGWGDIDRLAVGIGPGTFTGLRIGVATARALAAARGIPLAGVSTLESLARNAGLHSGAAATGAVAAVLDARRGEVFAAIWQGAERMLAPLALTPAELAAKLAEVPETVLVIGDGAVKFRAVLEPSGASIPEDQTMLHRVTAVNHCAIARGLHAGTPDQIVPEYLRLPDAEISRRSKPSA